MSGHQPPTARAGTALDVIGAADAARFGMLVEHAVTKLWYDGNQLDYGQSLASAAELATAMGDDEYLGCCPACCGPCHVLGELYTLGQLDDYLKASPGNATTAYYWDTDRHRLSRRWLLRAWSHTDRLACHEGLEPAEELISMLLNRLTLEARQERIRR